MSNVDIMVRYGLIPYRRNGDGFNGIDCVSLVKRYYKDFVGFELPESPWAWRHVLRRLETGERVKKNDILFMMGANRLKLTDHMAVVISNYDLIHAASVYGGVVCEPIERHSHLVLGIARLKNED